MNIIEKDTNVVGNGKDIIFADGRYYLVSESPAKVCYSENLESWTEIELNENYMKPKCLAFGNGMFILTGDAGTTKKTYIYYSKDGKNWIPKIVDTGESFSMHSNTCKFINNRFVFTTGYYTSSGGVRISTTKQFYETRNGTDISRHDFTVDGSENVDSMDVEYGKNQYICVGSNGSIYTSSNLINWNRKNSGIKDKLVGITYGKSKFVVVGDNGTILTSKDGNNWSKQESNTASYLIRSRYSNGMYIAVGYNGVILQSIDGVQWQNISKKTQGLRYGLCVNEDRFVISATQYNATRTIPIFYFDVTRNLSEDFEDSTLFFFDKNLNMLGIVDYFISLRWRRKYFEAGEFEIVLPVTDYIMQFIDTDVLVMRNNYSEAGIIETIEFSDNGDDEEVTISGRFLSCLFERRIVKSKINFSGNSIEGMNTIVNSMTPLTDQWETESVSMSSKSISFQCTYKNIYEYLCKICEYSGLGIRIVPNVDSKVYMFEVYSGKDRTIDQNVNEQYAFSDDNYNVEQGKLIISKKTSVNYVLIGGTGEDTSRIMANVDSGKTGFERYEIFSDQKSLSNSNLSSTEYLNKLTSVGEGKLSDGTFNLEVTALNLGDYQEKWNLGDIVNIKKEKWGIITSYRIIEVEETIEDGKKTIRPTFGNPFSSAWDDE